MINENIIQMILCEFIKMKWIFKLFHLLFVAYLGLMTS